MFLLANGGSLKVMLLWLVVITTSLTNTKDLKNILTTI